VQHKAGALLFLFDLKTLMHTKAQKTTPKTRDAAVTRERILKVAMKEFIMRGYEGARIDTIVAKSKISKNLVYHYFKSKEALFIEVMERTFADMRARQDEVILTGEDPVADMRRLVIQTIEYLIDQPGFISLLATENLHKAAHIKKSPSLQSIFNPMKAVLSGLLENGKAKGLFRQDVDWVDLYVSISGLGTFAISNRYTASYVLGADLGDPVRMSHRAEHAANMVISYLCDVEQVKNARVVKKTAAVAN
jgi:TetR/AcrR family transcriptional regulator